ncbi:hypothetical protein M0813_23822 [Anaeramoeba flamelloides]|uniref:Uncharacterized protein n=1 Tax=Anaeramoeba flamelloides TaxID=1746091 RepID=A0ABQ8Y8V5_9EUKA|nr:hypothetical protein M0813_23822 [Anaeramoeba flamelloides]
MSLKPNPTLTNNERSHLIENLKNVRSIEERLKLFLVLYPQSISGVSVEYPNPKTKSPKSTNKCKLIVNKEDLEHEVRISRNLLTVLSDFTKVSRRSLERGIASFFERKFGFQNIRPYSQSSLIFGNSKPISVRKKRVIVRLLKTNQILNQSPQISPDCQKKQSTKLQRLPKQQQKISQNKKQAIPNFQKNNTKPEKIFDLLPIISTTLISLKRDKRPSFPNLQARKRNFNSTHNQQFSALQMLCEIAQLQKIKKTNLNHKI